MAEEYVIVKYDYVALEDQELTVKKGDRLLLFDDSRNWWKVRNEHNRVGFVPSNYVRKEGLVDKAKGTIKGLTKPRQRSQEFSVDDAPAVFSAAPDNRPVFSANQNNYGAASPVVNRVGTMKATVKFSYEPQLDDEMKLTKGEVINVVDKSSDGWWKGELNGQTGWFPSNYVDEIAETVAPVANGKSSENLRPANGNNNGTFNPPPVASPQHKNTLETVIALYSFEASTQEELSFRKGEKLEIVEHPAHDPDWWLAKNSRGQEGLVPRNYIDVVAQDGGGSGGIESEPWYFGRIGRDEADLLLLAGKEGEFLVRESESTPGDLSISMRGVERNKHFKVQTTDSQLRIGSRSFADMNQLIEHYTSHPIFSSSTEKLYLLRPLRK